MKKYIDSNELMKIIQASKETLNEWRKSELFPIQGKRKKSYVYNPEKVMDWLVSTGKLVHAERLRIFINGKTKTIEKVVEKNHAKEKEVATGEPIVKELDFQMDKYLKDMDIFKAKELLGQLLVKAAERLSQAGGMQIAFETNNFSKLTTELRQLETSCIEIDKELKKIAPVDVMQKWIAEIFTKIKTDLRTLPFSITDEIAALLQTDKKTEISEIIKRKVDDSLRHLSREFKT